MLWSWRAVAIETGSSPMPEGATQGATVDDPIPNTEPDLSRPVAHTTNAPVAVAAPAAPPEAPVVVEVEEPTPDHAGILNSARRFALGMIETGNNDRAVGGLGEVSRFQIMPSVWKHYSTSRNYRNPGISAAVAGQHWMSLYGYFKQQTGREPTDFDMYVLWNTRYGYYAVRGFSPARLSPVVRDRAQRFANLVEDGYRRESMLAMADVR